MNPALKEHFKAKAEVDLYQRAIRVNALIRCAMLADDNASTHVAHKGIADVLAVAEELMGEVIDGIEVLERASWKEAAE